MRKQDLRSLELFLHTQVSFSLIVLPRFWMCFSVWNSESWYFCCFLFLYVHIVENKAFSALLPSILMISSRPNFSAVQLAADHKSATNSQHHRFPPMKAFIWRAFRAYGTFWDISNKNFLCGMFFLKNGCIIFFFCWVAPPKKKLKVTNVKAALFPVQCSMTKHNYLFFVSHFRRKTKTRTKGGVFFFVFWKTTLKFFPS